MSSVKSWAAQSGVVAEPVARRNAISKMPDAMIRSVRSDSQRCRYAESNQRTRTLEDDGPHLRSRGVRGSQTKSLGDVRRNAFPQTILVGRVSSDGLTEYGTGLELVSLAANHVTDSPRTDSEAQFATTPARTAVQQRRGIALDL